MAGIILEKGNPVYTYGQPMTNLHLVTGGRIEVSFPGGTYTLGKGDVIGICEICSEIHFLNYTVLEEASILTYPFTSMDSLEDILQKNPDMARLFLLSLFRQITVLQNQCTLIEMNCSTIYRSLSKDYEKYRTLCPHYRLSPRTLEHYEEFSEYLCDETPDLWLNSFYLGLTRLYASDNYKYLVSDAAVSSGMLRKGSLDFRKTYQVVDEQYNYLRQVAEFYFNQSGNDLFDFYTSLYYKLSPDDDNALTMSEDIQRMIQQVKELHALDEQMINSRVSSFQSNHRIPTPKSGTRKEHTDNSAVMSQLSGSLNTILEFAGMEPAAANTFRQHVHAYKQLEDRASTDEIANLLRRKLTEEFYTLYTLTFHRTLESLDIPMAVRMFLYFGYVDEELAGSDNCVQLYELVGSMSDYSASGVYTFYDWLLAIYNGSKEPSRNEFEQEYTDLVHKKKAVHNLSDAEVKKMENDALAKVDFELQNMFVQVNKITFGRITTFCPLFSSDNVLKDLKESYVTASKIGKYFQKIRQIDYTAFYRESMDTENLSVMGKEIVHFEYLPDVILMPNAGIRGVMWQEIEGKRRNSPGRMMFSIFHLEDLRTTMIRLTGEFRWEMCKRMQGARWNDIGEPSLTSEYFDYIQFYRKNHDLTTEAKEKLRSSLQRAKNSFKEMFVRDYIIWVLFEGSGAPRMNKVARRIMFTYCPFSAPICESMEQNPLYTELLHRRNVHTAQRVHHLEKLRKKILNSGARLPESFDKEVSYAQGIIVN